MSFTAETARRDRLRRPGRHYPFRRRGFAVHFVLYTVQQLDAEKIENCETRVYCANETEPAWTIRWIHCWHGFASCVRLSALPQQLQIDYHRIMFDNCKEYGISVAPVVVCAWLGCCTKPWPIISVEFIVLRGSWCLFSEMANAPDEKGGCTRCTPA